MKLKLLWLMAIAIPAIAQVSNPSIVLVTSAPTGSCTAGLPDQQVSTTGALYTCQNGTWGQVPTSGGGGSSFPFTVVQELQGGATTGATTQTVTFPQAAAASGNTLWILIASDGSQTIGMPAGWTVDFNQAATSYSRLTLLHKTSAGDTSAAFTGTSFSCAYYFFELAGARSLDTSSTGATGNAVYNPTPAITPAAGSLVFNAVAGAFNNIAASLNGLVALPSMNPAWKNFGVSASAGAGARFLAGFVGTQAATNISTTPPMIQIMPTAALANSPTTQYTGAGIAYATFSIK